MDFYNILNDLCKQNNTNVSLLLKSLNLSTGNTGSWKKGMLPKGETLMQIADYFNVSIDYLLGRDIQSDEPICNTSVTIKRKGIKHVYSVSDDTVDIVEGLLKKLSNQE